MIKAKPHRYLIPLAAFLAVLPLLLKGPTCGHDFDFHLLSWLEAATQYAHGGYPHWAFTPAYGAGEPRFLFYPPVSWTLGALLTVVLPIQYVATAYTFVALTLAGFTGYRLASRYAPPRAALLCAMIYLANPYMLFTAYERSAFAELLAAAWFPLLFEAALNAGCPIHASTIVMSGTTRSSRILRIAIPIALLWLTNAPAAVMGCYALAILTFTQLLTHRSPNPGAPGPGSPPSDSARWGGALASETWVSTSPVLGTLALTTLAGTTLGLLLPAFYLLPAAYERRYVQITLATISGMRPADHFLFHRMASQTPDDLFHNAVVLTASLISVLLLGAVAVAAIAACMRPKKFNMGVFIPLTALIAFLLTPPSLFLWNHTPQLAYLQFPWRLDALLAVILLVIAANALRASNVPVWLPIVAAAALIVPSYQLFHQPCEAADAPAARAALFHSPFGTEPTDEYTPVTADNDALHRSKPWWFRCLGTHPDPNDASSLMAMPGPAPIHIENDLPCNALVIINRRAYPTWLVDVNGHALPAGTSNRDDGLISFTLPKGHMSLHIRYRRTPDQKLGLLLSALALLLAAWLFWHSRRQTLSAVAGHIG